jgi:hypothetical protein
VTVTIAWGLAWVLGPVLLLGAVVLGNHLAETWEAAVAAVRRLAAGSPSSRDPDRGGPPAVGLGGLGGLGGLDP